MGRLPGTRRREPRKPSWSSSPSGCGAALRGGITDLVDSSPGMVRTVVHSEGWHNIGSEDCDVRVRLPSVKHCQHPPRLQKFIARQCLVAPHRLLHVHKNTSHQCVFHHAQ